MKRQIPDWGKQCKVQMLLMGISLQDLSNKTGYSRTYISAVMNGRIISPMETVKKITDALGVPMELS